MIFLLLCQKCLVVVRFLRMKCVKKERRNIEIIKKQILLIYAIFMFKRLYNNKIYIFTYFISCNHTRYKQKLFKIKTLIKTANNMFTH